MIDPIGVTPGTVRGGKVESESGKIVPLAAPRPAQAVTEMSARETAKAMAARPPVDADRVATIKRALQEGRYPVVPAKIADQLIAAQLRWVEKK